MDFDVLKIIFYIAVILIATKFCGMVTRKLGLPQVVGMVVAGFLVGPAIFSNLPISFNGIINPTDVEMDVLKTFSEIGVILILFSSGLETNFKDLKKSGFSSTMIALAGVIVPIILGAAGALIFMGGLGEISNPEKLLNAFFVGCILAATSVGITVETLRELGKLSTRAGVAILSAAIIDDVIGIIALSVISSFKNGTNVGITLLKAVGFFVFTIGIGLLMRKIFKIIVARHPEKRRTRVFALAMCLMYAYCAEEFFGIAAITGAYMAGLMLSGLKDTKLIDKKIVINSYMFFSPIFFAFIGISADFSNFSPSSLLFGIVIVVLGIVGKIIGCSFTAKLCKYSKRQSLAIGCGMIARGEVALAVYSTGSSLIYTDVAGNVLGIDPLVATIMLIIITSILCPILLKVVFNYKINKSDMDKNFPKTNDESEVPQVDTEGREGGYNLDI